MSEWRPLSKVVGADPSKGHPAYALFLNGELQAVHIEHAPREAATVPPPFGHRDAHICVESQYIDRGSNIKDNDILRLAIAAGQMSMHFDSREFVSAGVWKSNAPKESFQKFRIWPCLTEVEQYVLHGYKKTELKDLLDAVGIGLWKLRRL